MDEGRVAFRKNTVTCFKFDLNFLNAGKFRQSSFNLT